MVVDDVYDFVRVMFYVWVYDYVPACLYRELMCASAPDNRLYIPVC